MAPVAVVPDGYFFLWNSHFFLSKSRRGAPNCSDFQGRSRRHRIAFNSLYLFSSRSINYKANGEELYDFTRGAPISSSPSGGLRVLTLFPVDAQKHPGGVASMTRDRGYPDWLVLSARLLWAGRRCKIYVLVVFPSDYVKILQPVAICTVIFVTLGKYTLCITLPHCFLPWLATVGPRGKLGVPQHLQMIAWSPDSRVVL